MSETPQLELKGWFDHRPQEKARFLHAVFDASGRGLGTGSEVAPLKQIRSGWSNGPTCHCFPTFFLETSRNPTHPFLHAWLEPKKSEAYWMFHKMITYR